MLVSSPYCDSIFSPVSPPSQPLYLSDPQTHPASSHVRSSHLPCIRVHVLTLCLIALFPPPLCHFQVCHSNKSLIPVSPSLRTKPPRGPPSLLFPSSSGGGGGFPSSLPSNCKTLKYPSLRTPSPSQRLIHSGMALFPPQPSDNIKIQNGQLNPSSVSDLIVMVLPAVPGRAPPPPTPRPL